MTDTSLDSGLTAWRDRAVDGDPSSPIHRTARADIRAFVQANANERVIDRQLIAQSATGARAYPTWTALAADTSRPVRTLAVVGLGDTGTHTDPVVGGTVKNSGYFTWSASPAGWQRLFDVFPAQAPIPCDVVKVGSYWEMTPKAGLSVVSLGVDQVFFGRAPEASPASLAVRVVGINTDEERVVKRADGSTTVTTGDILVDGFFSVYYHSPPSARDGLFQLVDGLASSGSASGGGLFTKMAQSARVDNTVDLAAAAGYSLPNNTGDDTIMVWEVEADGLPDASWLFRVAGINGADNFAVKYRDGTVLGPTTAKAGDRLFFGRPGGTGAWFTIEDHWRADTAQARQGGLTRYQQAAARGAAERAATAERLARRALAAPFGFAAGAGGTVVQASSKSTGVTLNKLAGRITLNAASLAAGAAAGFTLTNSEIAADDVVLVTIKSGATPAAYELQVEATAAGSCAVSIRNRSGGALAEAVVLNFVVIKSVAA